ncbi:MAG: DUF2997 domain-containing protein [Pirellulales bacterium]|nr:DUF2997 domain-containing protein [Pirellulales bacterium]
MTTIEIHVSPQGEVRLAPRGFAGASCDAATRALEAALGAIVERRRTSEFYAVESAAGVRIEARPGGSS